MSLRIQKFLSMLALVTFVIAYAISVMVLAVDAIGEMSPLVETLFYLTTGFIWIIPARALLLWGQRRD